MSRKLILEKVQVFLHRFIGDREIAEDEEIFSTGLVNSLFAMQLVLFLEKMFDVKVENADLDLKNFKSLRAIADFVVHKQSNLNNV